MKKLIIFSSILVAGLFLLCSNYALAASPGDVVITEYMANPTGSDTDREWIELKNVSGGSLSLEDWKINDGSNHVISGSFVMANNSVAVVCKNNDVLVNGDVDCDYVASITFTNTGDTIFLRDSSDATIDSVTYVEGEILEGYSTYYDNGWQNELVYMYNNTEYGTPGTVSGETTDDKTGEMSGDVELTLLNVIATTEGTTATISFSINADSSVLIDYGESDAYGGVLETGVSAGEASVDILGLDCSKTYHYKLSVNSNDEIAETMDDTFSVICGNIDIDSMLMTKTKARANDEYDDGWQWTFDITVWDELEDKLQMRFGEWASVDDSITSADNIRFSVTNGSVWTSVKADNTYSSLANIVDMDGASNGTQVRVLVEMRVPAGTKVGAYGSQYGIRTE